MIEATILDCHVHFRDPGSLPYPWLDEFPSLRRAFLPPPVVTLAGTREDGYGLTRRFTAAWSETEREACYVGNAERFYGLETRPARGAHS